ncbi:hypothetical protein D3C75_809440 [compost metagenome]
MADYRALQRHADPGTDGERHWQGDQRVELDGAGGVALQQHLDHVGAVGAEHQHLAVGHVDHPEQAEGDRKAQRCQQQDRTQRQAAESLAEQFAYQQFALDLGQARFGGCAHARV